MPTPPPSWINTLLQFFRWLWRTAVPDHSSLFGGWYTQSYSGRKYVYVAVACAPSRRFRSARPVAPEVALGFLEQLMPGAFAFPAAQSFREVVAFEMADGDENPPMHEPARAARIWAKRTCGAVRSCSG